MMVGEKGIRQVGGCGNDRARLQTRCLQDHAAYNAIPMRAYVTLGAGIQHATYEDIILTS